MNRSLIIGIAATIALFAGVAVYFYFHNIKAKNKPATEAVPNDAFVIFQTRDLKSSWQTFEKSVLWNDLKKNQQLNAAQQKLTRLVQIIENNDDIEELISDNTTALSLHNSNNQINFITITETGQEINVADVANYFAQQLGGKILKHNFEKIPVYDINDENGEVMVSFSFKENLLICSPDAGLIEESLRKIKYQIPNATKGFEQVQLLAETGADANLYINYQKVPAFFNHFLKAEYQGLFNYTKQFANWSMLDVELNQDQFKLTGVTYTDDSIFQFLDLFKNQTPKALKLQEFMPKNTSLAFQMGFTDYVKFNSELNEYLQIHGKADSYARFSDSLENRYNIDLSQQVIPFIDGEASLIMTEPAGSDYKVNLAAVIRFKDPISMAQSLKKMVASMHQKGETDSTSYFHNGFEIERIKLDNFLKLYYGEIMENIQSPYYTQLNDVFVFANTEATLKFIIDEFKAGNTLANDERFKAYQKTLAPNNNVNIFISPSRNFLLPSTFVTDTFFSTLNMNQYDFKKFEFINIQFANTNNKAFYTNIQYQFNAVKANETQLLWSTKLDTTFETAPKVVYNTQLKQHVIFVQDVKNTLYCVSNSGNVLWKSKLSSKIIGDFIEIDAKQNGSLCYLFSTEKQANLIDENGVSLYGFPIYYPGKTSLPLTLIDFYNDSTYEFYVPLENSRVVGYSLNGKPIAGFNPKALESKAVMPINWLTIGSKPYLYTTTVRGQLVLIDHKGKSIKTENTVVGRYFEHVSTTDSNITTFKAIDTASNLVVIELDSLLKFTEATPTGKSVARFDSLIAHQDIVTQKWTYFSFAKQKWQVLNDDWGLILEATYTDTLPQKCYLLHDINGKSFIGNVKVQEGKYYLYDANGKSYPDFPISGYGAFTIGKLMPDNTNYLIGGDKQNNIFVYKLK